MLSGFPDPDTSSIFLANSGSEARLTDLGYSTIWMTRAGSLSTHRFETSGWDGFPRKHCYFTVLSEFAAQLLIYKVMLCFKGNELRNIN
jgi:hypothetical protein